MADGPVHVSRPLADVLERIGISVQGISEAGYPCLAALVRRAIEEAGEATEPGTDEPEPYEPPRLRILR